MALPSALAQDPPLFLKPHLVYKEYTNVCLKYTHTPEGSGPITHKCDVVFCPDITDKECLLCIIDEFIDSCSPNLLHLDDADHYTLFCQGIGGFLKATWDTVLATTHPGVADHTNANFPMDVCTFVHCYLPSNSSTLQNDYFDIPCTTKPHDYDCYKTHATLTSSTVSLDISAVPVVNLCMISYAFSLATQIYRKWQLHQLPCHDCGSPH